VAWTAEQQREYHAQWYRENRDAERAKQKAWRERNRVRQREYRQRKRAERAAQTAAWKAANRERVREIQARRKMRARNDGQEPYVRGEIFERDGWSCGICGEPVDRALVSPNPGAATIDHVVPLSAGGPDTPENVRLAHFGCNAAFGAHCSWMYGRRAAA
jgi:5-methylcytosine-specific restriction endonuclease McrA